MCEFPLPVTRLLYTHCRPCGHDLLNLIPASLYMFVNFSVLVRVKVTVKVRV